MTRPQSEQNTVARSFYDYRLQVEKNPVSVDEGMNTGREIHGVLQSVEPFANDPNQHAREPRPCVYCGIRATKTAHFKTEGAIILERYCDTCVKTIPT